MSTGGVSCSKRGTTLPPRAPPDVTDTDFAREEFATWEGQSAKFQVSEDWGRGETCFVSRSAFVLFSVSWLMLFGIEWLGWPICCLK